MYCVRHGLSSSYSNEFRNVRPENRFIEVCQDLYRIFRRPQRSEGSSALEVRLDRNTFYISISA